jgi:hypothetical protein
MRGFARVAEVPGDWAAGVFGRSRRPASRWQNAGEFRREGFAARAKQNCGQLDTDCPSGQTITFEVFRFALLRVEGCGNRKKSILFDVINTWLEAVRFGADIQRVMALRMMRLASGGPLAATEARQMVAEKVSAFEEAQLAIATALATGSGLFAATAGAYAPYRRCVRANRLRLDA